MVEAISVTSLDRGVLPGRPSSAIVCPGVRGPAAVALAGAIRSGVSAGAFIRLPGPVGTSIRRPVAGARSKSGRTDLCGPVARSLSDTVRPVICRSGGVCLSVDVRPGISAAVAIVPVAINLAVRDESTPAALPVAIRTPDIGSVAVGLVRDMRPYIGTTVAARYSPVIVAMAWPEMRVSLPGTMSLVASIIRVPVMTDSLKGISVKQIGNVAVVNL